ncbi:MAG: hypothetical protein HY060_05710 [Proteobacteria bacterium]|nr:hypothetical protein [Pseudomonadota bacterium]
MAATHIVAWSIPCLWALSYLLPPLDGDVAAILDFAVRMVAGEQLYVDLFDVNPPLIFWLNLPAAWIAEQLALGPAVVFVVSVLGLQAASLVLCRAPTARLFDLERPFLRTVLPLVAAFVLLVLPTHNFGQREHLLTCFALPYLALAAVRLEGQAVTVREAAVRGAFAAVGFLIKPYFLLVPVAIEAVLLLRLGWRAWLRRPEPWLIVGLGALYLLTALVCHPSYFTEVVPLARRYYLASGVTASLERVFGEPERWLALVAMTPLVAWGMTARRPAALRVAALFTLAAAGSALIQGKGWPYHLLPFWQGCVMVVTFAAAAALRGAAAGAQPNCERARLAATVVFAAVVGTFAIEHPPWRDRLDYPGSFAGRLEALLARDAQGGRVLWLTDATYPKYPTVLYGRIRPASRFMELWLIDGLYQAAEGAPDRPRMRAPAQMSDDERHLFDAVGASLERTRPTLVLVASAAAELGVAVGQFDYLAYFLRHPSFAREWRHYSQVADIEGTRVFRCLDGAETMAGPGRRDAKLAQYSAGN